MIILGPEHQIPKKKKLKINIKLNDNEFNIEGEKGDVLETLDDLIQKGVLPKHRFRNVRENISVSPIFKNRKKKENIQILIKSICKDTNLWFTSTDILSKYEQHIGGEISLSTISTNLSRLETEGILQKRGNKKDIEYSLASQSLLESLPLYDEIERRFV